MTTTATPIAFPRVPLKQMDAGMLVFELDRETSRLMPAHASAELITSAATMAAFLHRKQTRMIRGDLPRVPYIEHPLRVALRLLRWGIDNAALIAAALLHDVLEDCAAELVKVFGQPGETAVACLVRLYGEDIAEHVSAVTNPEHCNVQVYRTHVADLAWSGKAALLIKASDLKDNAGSIKHQLGHGNDPRLLRMVGKYRPVVSDVLRALEAEHGNPISIFDVPPVARRAAAMDIRRLNQDLQNLKQIAEGRRFNERRHQDEDRNLPELP